MNISIEVAETYNRDTLQQEASVYVTGEHPLLLFTSETIGVDLKNWSDRLLQLIVGEEQQTFETSDGRFELRLQREDDQLTITGRNDFLERDEWAFDVDFFTFIEAFTIAATRFVNLVVEVDERAQNDSSFEELVQYLFLLGQTVDGF